MEKRLAMEMMNQKVQGTLSLPCEALKEASKYGLER
jgi:hypothetical protein